MWSVVESGVLRLECWGNWSRKTGFLLRLASAE